MRSETIIHYQSQSWRLPSLLSHGFHEKRNTQHETEDRPSQVTLLKWLIGSYGSNDVRMHHLTHSWCMVGFTKMAATMLSLVMKDFPQTIPTIGVILAKQN